MKIVCAWCAKEKNESAQVGASHGICDRHRREMLDSLTKPDRWTVRAVLLVCAGILLLAFLAFWAV